VRKLILQILAVILIVVGAVTFPLPIPIGAVLIVAGLALLISTSSFVARTIRRWRGRHPETDGNIRKAEDYLPERLRAPLDKTDPKRPDEDDTKSD